MVTAQRVARPTHSHQLWTAEHAAEYAAVIGADEHSIDAWTWTFTRPAPRPAAATTTAAPAPPSQENDADAQPTAPTPTMYNGYPHPGPAPRAERRSRERYESLNCKAGEAEPCAICILWGDEHCHGPAKPLETLTIEDARRAQAEQRQRRSRSRRRQIQDDPRRLPVPRQAARHGIPQVQAPACRHHGSQRQPTDEGRSAAGDRGATRQRNDWRQPLYPDEGPGRQSPGASAARDRAELPHVRIPDRRAYLPRMRNGDRPVERRRTAGHPRPRRNASPPAGADTRRRRHVVGIAHRPGRRSAEVGAPTSKEIES